MAGRRPSGSLHCVLIEQRDHFMLRIIITQESHRAEISILPCRCVLSPFILFFSRKFSLFRVAFIRIRAGVISLSSSCHFFRWSLFHSMPWVEIPLAWHHQPYFPEGKAKNFCNLFKMNCPLNVGRPVIVIGLRRKRGPVILTRTAWVRFMPSLTHETCLRCSAISDFIYLACFCVGSAQMHPPRLVVRTFRTLRWILFQNFDPTVPNSCWWLDIFPEVHDILYFIFSNIAFKHLTWCTFDVIPNLASDSWWNQSQRFISIKNILC